MSNLTMTSLKFQQMRYQQWMLYCFLILQGKNAEILLFWTFPFSCFTKAKEYSKSISIVGLLEVGIRVSMFFLN